MRRRRNDPSVPEPFHSGDLVKAQGDDTLYKLTGHVTTGGDVEMVAAGALFPGLGAKTWRNLRHVQHVRQLPRREEEHAMQEASAP